MKRLLLYSLIVFMLGFAAGSGAVAVQAGSLTTNNTYLVPLYCLGHALTPSEQWQIAKGMSIMHQNPDSEQLYQLIVRNHICVSSGNLPKNIVAYTYYTLNPQGRYATGTIEFNKAYLKPYVSQRFIAATLYHEATHHLNLIDGTSCVLTKSCTITKSKSGGSSYLQEEIAAYRAEAKWWLEMYGPAGPPNPDPYDNDITNLADSLDAGTIQFNQNLAARIGS